MGKSAAYFVKIVPPHMTSLMLPFNWEVQKVWALSAPVELVPIGGLDFLLHHPFWSRNPASYTDFDLCPGEVLLAPEEFPEHQQRIADSDTSWPLDFIEHDGRLWILDGIHRLLRLHQLGVDRVQIRKHPLSVQEQIDSGQ